MELAKKFEEATSCQSVNISSLEMDKKYPIVRAQRISSKFGPTVSLTIRDSESTTIQTFLPKRHSPVVSDDDIDKIVTWFHCILHTKECVKNPNRTY